MMIVEGYGNQGVPRQGGTERVIDLGLEVPDTHDIMGIIRTDFDKESDGSRRVSDQLTPAIRYERINTLVASLMKLADATFADATQRNAFKDLLMQVPWSWYHAQENEMVEPWRKDKFPKYKNAFDLPTDKDGNR